MEHLFPRHPSAHWHLLGWIHVPCPHPPLHTAERAMKQLEATSTTIKLLLLKQLLRRYYANPYEPVEQVFPCQPLSQ